MDGSRFDRLTKTLIAILPRRGAVKVLAGGGLAAAALSSDVDEAGAGKKKRRCRKQGRRCGGKKKCCGNKLKCQNITKPGCDHVTGQRCCGLAGAVCDNDADDNNHCDCCDGFFCSGTSGLGNCQSTVT